MAIRNLRSWDDSIFRRKSKAVDIYDESLWTLLDDMLETLIKAKGYGCAAVHVGVLKRVVVINDENGVIEFVNPFIDSVSGETQEVMEGSIAPNSPPGMDVIRPKSVIVKGFDRNGGEIAITGEGFLAATLFHEIDHLDGILFSDKARK